MPTRKTSVGANGEEEMSVYDQIIAERKAERAQRAQKVVEQDDRSLEEILIDDIKKEVASYNAAKRLVVEASGRVHLQRIAKILLVTPRSMRLLDQNSRTYIAFISGNIIPEEVKDQVKYLIKLDDPRLSTIRHIPETLKGRLFMRLLVWANNVGEDAAWHHGWGRHMLSTFARSEKAKIKEAFPKRPKELLERQPKFMTQHSDEYPE